MSWGGCARQLRGGWFADCYAAGLLRVVLPLMQDEDQAFRKFKLRVEDVQGKNCLTNFWVRAPLGTKTL